MPQSASFYIDMLGSLVALILFIDALSEKAYNSSQHKLFVALLLATALALPVDAVSWELSGRSFYGSYSLQLSINTSLYIMLTVYGYLWTQYTACFVIREQKKLMLLGALSSAPLLLELALLIMNLRTGWIFSISGDLEYTRGDFFPLGALIPFIYVAISFIMSVAAYAREKALVKKKRCLYIMLFIVFPVSGAVLQCFVPHITMLPPLIVVSLLMEYLRVQKQEIEESRLQLERQQSELLNSRFSIMLSQIQPHFLYNSLCTIQDLCHGRAPEAEAATIEFSAFLRQNLDALSAQAPVPLEQELSHVKNYLSLEQKRFGDRLKVEYDIKATDFRMPVLSLQPLVENAVRCGVMKRESGGTVRISTEETGDAYLVRVSDDGVGFNTQSSEGGSRSHVGIPNIEGRLRIMCGGSLNICSVPDAGTDVTITIPKEGAS